MVVAVASIAFFVVIVSAATFSLVPQAATVLSSPSTNPSGIGNPTPTPTPSPTPSPTATPSTQPGATPTPTPTPTHTPTPTLSKNPTPTPTPTTVTLPVAKSPSPTPTAVPPSQSSLSSVPANSPASTPSMATGCVPKDGATITGMVTTKDDSGKVTPIPNATVFDVKVPSRKDSTKPTGQYSLSGYASCTTATIHVTAAGYQDAEQTIPINEGTNTLNFELITKDCQPKPATIQGTVKGGTRTLTTVIEDVKITLESANAKINEKTTQTDEQGHYEFKFDGLTSCVRLRARAEYEDLETSYSDWKSLQPLPQNNVIDFLLNYNGPDELAGTVTIQNGKPQKDIKVTAIRKNNPLETYSTLTDSDGTYILNDHFSVGEYTISARLPGDTTPLTTTPTVISVTFTKPKGELIVKDFQIVPKPGPYTVRVVVMGVNRLSSYTTPPLTDANVSVYSGKANSGNPIPLTRPPQQDSPFYTYVLQNGNYTAVAIKAGYTTNQMEFTVQGIGQNVVILLTQDNPHCIRKPHPNVKAFWFCGNEAVSMADDAHYTPDWDAIDSTIGMLRSRYGYNTLPLQVLITDSIEDNASYIESPSCPPLSTNADREDEPEMKERIVYTTQTFKANSAQEVAHDTVHEWGHGKDWREGHCLRPRSLETDFTDLRGMLSSQQINLLKDSNFDPIEPTFGHPDDNPQETYASGFHAWALHEKQVETIIAPIPENAKNALERIGHITQIPEGGSP